MEAFALSRLVIKVTPQSVDALEEAERAVRPQQGFDRREVPGHLTGQEEMWAYYVAGAEEAGV